MKHAILIALLILVLVSLTGCLVEEELPSAITPHFFATATIEAASTATPALPTATPLLPFLGGTAGSALGVTPTVQGVAGHPCPYRLSGDFLALYSGEPAIELSMGCPTTPDDDTPIHLWPVTIRYQAFENGQIIWISNRGWEEKAQLYVLRKNQIYTRHEDRYNPDYRPTATPTYGEDESDPFIPPPGFYKPTGAIEQLWRSDPDVFANLGFATDTAIIMESEMLILDYGELIRLPGLRLMFALKAGNPGTWTVYALPNPSP